jgi:dTDP-4-amino-4,6-dideoxygalactose transaminase/acetyltransferase-like isoleucine patch superfamily enzyme
MTPDAPFVHATAWIEPGAVIGAGTSIWHHSQVRRHSVIGTGCTLGKNVFIDEGVHIGDRVKIQNNVSVYRGVELADEVFVGPSAVFTNDLRPRAGTEDWQLSPTQVRRGASVGANATIVCGLEIGQSAMVGAGAVVTSSVLPHQLVAGNPARHRGWVCGCGEVVSRAERRPDLVRCQRCRKESDASPAANAEQRGRIQLAKVTLGREEEDAVLGVLRSGQLASGPCVQQLEQAFARVHESAHAVAVSSGTAALVVALRAHGIGPGDEVITSPLSFVATLNAILEVGATARFADITDDFTMDPAALDPLITPRTKALMPVHLYGLPAAMRKISEIAHGRALALIGDAAQAHGARVNEASVAALGTAAFSLYATKNITCGEGGLITTSNDEVADRMRLLRNHGMRNRYEYLMPGYNFRLTDLQASVASAQLRKLPAICSDRSRNAALLSGGLADLPGLVLPAVPAGRQHVWHQYTVQVTAEALVDRDQLGKILDAAGIDTGVYYPRLIHDYPCYQDNPQVIRDRTPRAERAAREVLSLPVHPHLTSGNIDRIVSCVREALDR